jgi:hypothetical protein
MATERGSMITKPLMSNGDRNRFGSHQACDDWNFQSLLVVIKHMTIETFDCFWSLIVQLTTWWSKFLNCLQSLGVTTRFFKVVFGCHLFKCLLETEKIQSLSDDILTAMCGCCMGTLSDGNQIFSVVIFFGCP